MTQGLPSEPPRAGRPEPVHPKPPTPAGSKAPRRPASNLALRLVTAAVLIPPVVWIVFRGGPWLLGAVVLITLAGVHEFYQLIEAKGADPVRGLGTVAAVSLPVVVYLGSVYAATILMSFLLLGVLVAQLGKSRITESLASVSGTFFGVFYVGWLLAHAIQLRNFERVVAARWGVEAVRGMDPNVGAFYLFFTIAVVIGGDAGAYFFGRAYGKRKLAPRVSPAKTVEGALGAVFAGFLVAMACKGGVDALAPRLSANLGWLACGVLGVVLAIVGIVGDLVESLLKRDAQVKDTGSLLPGTGGVLDRIDSNLLAIPVMYYLLLAYTFLTGPSSPMVGPTRLG
jgi:phosphatidate cytidylyltransferase